MNTETPPSLRDKKRAETRALLEKAAVELVISDGLEHATIDAISERAFVSPRTFFNYFDSKEDAILGIRDLEITEDVLPEILRSTDARDLAASVVHVLFYTMALSIENFSLHDARKQAVRRYPQLLGRQMTQMFRMGKQLTALTQTLMDRDPAFHSNTLAESARLAEVLLALCGSAVRGAAWEWAAAGGGGSAEDIEQRAIALVRQVVEKLR